MAAFLDVIFRGIALGAQSALLGATVFVLVVLRPWQRAPYADEERPLDQAIRRLRRVVLVAAFLLAAMQGASLATAVTALADESRWPLAALASTAFFGNAAARIALALALGGVVSLLRRRGRARSTWWLLAGLAVALLAPAAALSHAAARLGDRATLVALDALHQLAGGIWIGGLLCLVVISRRTANRRWSDELLSRFSPLALAAVVVLAIAGIGLSLAYIDTPAALIGTAYGVMVLTKSGVLCALLALGAANFRAVRRLATAGPPDHIRVRRYVEVELGLGLTVLLAAASLTSLPPAADVRADRATPAEVANRFAPRWPVFSSPRHAELPAGDREAARTDQDRAWSEYNHHVAGLFVLVMGVLATVSGLDAKSVTRHWPLVFLLLGAFLFSRNDPGAWPLGPQGFWESLAEPAVLQHRFFVLLVLAFGVFEWGVRTGRFASSRWQYVFPLLCAVGGGVLLSHSHAMLNLKSELLIEVTHTPVALLGTLVGWGRWLELRLPPPENRLPGRLGAVALALVGVVLLIYRES